MKPRWLNPSTFPVTRDYVSLNQIMVGCGCCPFPECETPLIEIESKDGVLCAITLDSIDPPESSWIGTPAFDFGTPEAQTLEESVRYRQMRVQHTLTRRYDELDGSYITEVSVVDIIIAKIPRTFPPNDGPLGLFPCADWQMQGSYTMTTEYYDAALTLRERDVQASTMTFGDTETAVSGTYTVTVWDEFGVEEYSTNEERNAMPEPPDFADWTLKYGANTAATTFSGSQAVLSATAFPIPGDYLTITLDPAYLDETAGADISTSLAAAAPNAVPFLPSYSGNVTTGQTILAFLDTTYVGNDDKDEDPRILAAEGGTSRYRMKIPAGYARTVWEMEWDESFYPQEWLDWLDRKTAHEAWEIAHAAFPAIHAAWVTAGSIPPEPTDPVEPLAAGTEPPAPSIHASRSWTWDGITDESAWFTVAMPEEQGEIRLTNVGTICYHSTRTGVLPCLSSEHRRHTPPP